MRWPGRNRVREMSFYPQFASIIADGNQVSFGDGERSGFGGIKGDMFLAMELIGVRRMNGRALVAHVEAARCRKPKAPAILGRLGQDRLPLRLGRAQAVDGLPSPGVHFLVRGVGVKRND